MSPFFWTDMTSDDDIVFPVVSYDNDLNYLIVDVSDGSEDAEEFAPYVRVSWNTDGEWIMACGITVGETVEELEELTEEDISTACEEEWVEVRSPVDLGGEWAINYSPFEPIYVSPFTWTESGMEFPIVAYSNDEAYLVALVEEAYARVNWRASEDGFIDLYMSWADTLEELTDMSAEDIESGWESSETYQVREWLEITGEWLDGELFVSSFTWDEADESFDLVAFDNDEDFLVVELPEGYLEAFAVHIRVNWRLEDAGYVFCVDVDAIETSDDSIAELSARSVEESCSGDSWDSLE